MQFLKEFHSGASRVFGHPGLANTAQEERKTTRRGSYKDLLFCSNSSVKSVFVICEKKKFWDTAVAILTSTLVCHTDAAIMTGTDVQVVCCAFLLSCW